MSRATCAPMAIIVIRRYEVFDYFLADLISIRAASVCSVHRFAHSSDIIEFGDRNSEAAALQRGHAELQQRHKNTTVQLRAILDHMRSHVDE